MASTITRLHDPYLKTSSRVEFRLGDYTDTMFLKNLRLINVGVSTTTNSFYNIVLGSLGVIKNMYLLDGSKRLDVCQHASMVMAFKTLAKRNDINYSIEAPKIKNALGQRVGYVSNSSSPEGAIRIQATDETHANLEGTNLGYLELNECFNFLENIKLLDTNLFKDLRVVIDLETRNKTNIVRYGDRVNEVVSPILVTDEIPKMENEKMRGWMMSNVYQKGFNFVQVESDTVYIDSFSNPSSGEKQKLEARINGFDNKYVSRVMVKRTPKTSQDQVGFLGSTAFKNLSEDFIINNKSLFERGGVIDDNFKRGAYLVDSYGEFTCPFGSNVLNVAGNNTPTDPEYIMDQTVFRLKSNLSYTGLMIEQRISDANGFMYVMEREHSATPADECNQPHSIQFFADVLRTFRTDGKRYDIQYL